MPSQSLIQRIRYILMKQEHERLSKAAAVARTAHRPKTPRQMFPSTETSEFEVKTEESAQLRLKEAEAKEKGNYRSAQNILAMCRLFKLSTVQMLGMCELCAFGGGYCTFVFSFLSFSFLSFSFLSFSFLSFSFLFSKARDPILSPSSTGSPPPPPPPLPSRLGPVHETDRLRSASVGVRRERLSGRVQRRRSSVSLSPTRERSSAVLDHQARAGDASARPPRSMVGNSSFEDQKKIDDIVDVCVLGTPPPPPSLSSGPRIYTPSPPKTPPPPEILALARRRATRMSAGTSGGNSFFCVHFWGGYFNKWVEKIWTEWLKSCTLANTDGARVPRTSHYSTTNISVQIERLCDEPQGQGKVDSVKTSARN